MLPRFLLLGLLLAFETVAWKLTATWRKTVTSAIAATAVCWQHPLAGHAITNQLADVGLKEFLVKDGREWLRLSLPSADAAAKEAQEDIELIRLRLEQVGFSSKAPWGGAVKDASLANGLIVKNKDAWVDKVTDGKSKDAARRLINDELLPNMNLLLNALRTEDIATTNQLQEVVGAELGELRAMQLPANKLPFDIPAEYSSLPRLNGRAEVEMVVTYGGGGTKKGYRLADDVTVVPKITLKMVVDGYHAPLTAGSFVDLVSKRFYDGMSLQQVQELIVQTGKPANGVDGFIETKTGKLRQIPLELFYKRDAAPTYGATSDDDMRATDAMALPFQAYGALGMARGNEDVDSASSQFFLVKWDQGLIAPGRNTLDGFYRCLPPHILFCSTLRALVTPFSPSTPYSCFGFVTENEDILKQMTDKDTISMKVTKGLENLVVP